MRKQTTKRGSGTRTDPAIQCNNEGNNVSYPVTNPSAPRQGRKNSILAVVLIIPLVLALAVGIGVGVLMNRPGGNLGSSSEPWEEKTIQADHYSADVLDGKFHIESTSLTRGPVDQDGADTLLVTLTMTNNTDDPEFVMLHIPRLFQNGIDLDLANLDPNEHPDIVSEMNDDMIRPGDTTTIVVGYKYLKVGEPVVFATELSEGEHYNDFPNIVVQPS